MTRKKRLLEEYAAAKEEFHKAANAYNSTLRKYKMSFLDINNSELRKVCCERHKTSKKWLKECKDRLSRVGNKIADYMELVARERHVW